VFIYHPLVGVLKLVDAPAVEDLYRSLVELQFDGLTVEWVHNPRHVCGRTRMHVGVVGGPGSYVGLSHLLF